MATDARQSDYVTYVRQAARNLWEAHNDLKALQAEWNAQDYGNTLVIGAEGENAGLTPAQIGAVAFATTDAIEVVMLAGNATNITNIL